MQQGTQGTAQGTQGTAQGTQGTAASSRYALLVGVNDYTSFDGKDAYALNSSRNNVALLAWFCMNVLGMPAANVRVLTAPALTNDDLQNNDNMRPLRGLDRANIGPATEDEVRRGIAWLLEATRGDGASGIFSFSGHGAWAQDRGPLLCLGDTAPDLVKGVLPLRDLGGMIARAGARSKIVAVLDCCHVTAPQGAAPGPGQTKVMALPHRGSADDVAHDDDAFDVSERVLLAARPGKPGYEMRLGMQPHGALTFALVTAAERWRATAGALHGSYEKILKRANKVLKALYVDQKLCFHTPSEPRRQIRKQPFLGLTPAPTVRRPDAEKTGQQIDGGWTYTFTAVNNGQQYPLAWVVATGSQQMRITLNNGVTYSAQANTECWFVNTGNLYYLTESSWNIQVSMSLLTTGTSITVPAGFSGNGTGTGPYFTANESTTWSPSSSLRDPPSGVTTAYYQCASPAGGTPICMRWDRTGLVGDYSLNQVVWFFMSSSVPAYIMPAGTSTPQTFNVMAAPPTGTFQWSIS